MNRRIDEVGRIVIPKEMRIKLGIANGDEVKIELVSNKIIITNPNLIDQFEEWLIKNNENYILAKYQELKK